MAYFAKSKVTQFLEAELLYKRLCLSVCLSFCLSSPFIYIYVFIAQLLLLSDNFQA